MLHVIFGFKFDIQYKPIKNCHVENAIRKKDFNLGASNSFFHVFTP